MSPCQFHTNRDISIDLQKKLSAVEADNKTIREEFNVQRAKLKELFLQKEGDLSFHLMSHLFIATLCHYSFELIPFHSQIQLAECKRLSEQLGDLRKELNETKSQVVVAEYKRETDIQNQDRKAQEEISSLQHLVHGMVGD